MCHQFLTVGEVCNILRLSDKTVLALIKKGEISSVRISSQVIRIPADKFDQYLKARTV